MQTDFIGKNALVGGSSKGIGRAIAEALARAGANITLLARNRESLEAVLQGLDTSKGQQHDYILADFSQPQTLSDALAAYAQKYPQKPFHILINNTGGPAGGKLVGTLPDAFRAAFEMHLVCNQILANWAIPSMRAEKFGRIINVISTSVKQPLENLGVSNTIRGAVANWAKTLATELAPFGITVNNLLPGATRTDRLEAILKNKSAQTGKSIQEISTEMLAEIPAGRFAEPEEIAQAAVFLASAGYVNGINLPVDGGRTKSL